MTADIVSLIWIIVFGLLMAVIALVGGVFVFLPERTLARWLKPMVAFAAGSLIGGAIFHMLPQVVESSHSHAHSDGLVWIVIGFSAFFALDQLLEWHHCHKPPSEHAHSFGALLLIADGVHNLLGGLTVGAIFALDFKAGLAAWFAAALHELPQEIGDFGALVLSGYSPKKAMLYNFLAALTFPLGGVIAWSLNQAIDVTFLVALGCGHFIYIGASDLIPEVKRSEKLSETTLRFFFYAIGVGFLYVASHTLHVH